MLEILRIKANHRIWKVVSIEILSGKLYTKPNPTKTNLKTIMVTDLI